MKRVEFVFYTLLVIYSCVSTSCQKSNDDECFNGDIHPIRDTIDRVETVKLQSVFLDGANYGTPFVYDSLIIFMNPKLKDHFYNVFNINTGQEIGVFCNKGGGPGEFYSLSLIYQLFKEKNELKALLFEAHKENILIWNISQSIREGKTIIETIPYTWKTENNNACYSGLFLKSRNELLAKVAALPIDKDDATLPIYQKRSIDANQCLRTYSIYKQTIKNSEASIIPEAFFNSSDAFKPDGTKIVQAMVHLPQLNIIDVETGKITGYRLENGEDFSVFKGKKEIKNHFVRLAADDKFIYALYWGKLPWGAREIPYINTIYIFDWKGKLVSKIATDHDVDKMCVDTVRNRIYIIGPKTDNVFYYDLDELNKGSESR